MSPELERSLFYIAMLLTLPAGGLKADDRSLFATANLNPFMQLYSVPAPADRAAPAPGRWAWQVAFDLSNNAIAVEAPSGERIVLDGETYRTRVSLYYGMSERLSAMIVVPLVAHSGGFMDSFIQDWHALFGMSNQRRRAFDDAALNFVYSAHGEERFALTDRSRGLGDVRLSTEWRLTATPVAASGLLLRFGLKLPTGSSRSLHGSGSTDLSVQLSSMDAQFLSAWDITLAWMIGGLWLGSGEVLETLRRDAVAIGSVGISRPVWRNLSARIQLDGHSAFYRSDLSALGSSAVQLAFGGSLALAAASRFDFAMIQNLRTDATPDFGIHLSWQGAF
jgi:hypothetical protein